MSENFKMYKNEKSEVNLDLNGDDFSDNNSLWSINLFLKNFIKVVENTLVLKHFDLSILLKRLNYL